MTLFDECVEALGSDIKIIDTSEQRALIDLLCDSFPFASWGLIKWEDFKKFKTVVSINDLDFLKSKRFYIIWDTVNPTIECSLGSILENLEDVVCVDLHMWLFSTDMDMVIEFYRGTEIKLGYIEDVK